ncbi:UNVERIFIED_CONTAM: hypothetical protein NCL1_14663 [Trichonephila clavipes]
MWVPVCLLGVISGFIFFVALNLTSEKYPNGGCPKILLRIFSYQVNEYFSPMDDEMVAELCKKPIAQPTEDMQIKDEPTEEIDAVGLRIPKKHSTDKSADAVKIAGPPSDKVPYLIEPVRDLKTPDEQKNALVKEILRNACAMFTPLVSPFFYFSNNTYKPEVIVQDLIIKPDFNGKPDFYLPYLVLILTS